MNRPITPPGDKKRQAYYAEADSWSADVAGTLRSSRRLAWTVAAVAGGIAALEAVALVVLMPLKTVVPYTLVVDRQTGYVQTVQGLKPGALSQDQAVAQSFLVQYVIARETFDTTDLRDNYRKVQLWSAGEAKDRYLRDMAASNPVSPLKLYPPTTTVQVTVKSVSLIGPGQALVRFDSERRDGGAASGARQPFSAVIAYRYTKAPMRMEDRFVNPLGFQVTRYRRDAETAGALPVTEAR